MNWFQKIKLSAYPVENAYLNSTMKAGFDPYDFAYELKDYLEREGELTPEMEEQHENDPGSLVEQWVATATNADKASFQQYVENRVGRSENAYDSPPYMHMSHEKMVPATWLVHFTDDANGVASQGFKYGHEDMIGLHLTTWKRDRQKRPGYNFAFLATDSRNISMGKKYGSEAVVFWSSAVQVYHYGDQESQLIFWGPGVNPSMIFPITPDSDSGQWVVPNEWGRRVFSSEDIDDCIGWIIQNHAELNAQKQRQQLTDLRTRKKKR